MIKGESLISEYNFPTEELEFQGEQPEGGIAKTDRKGKVSIAVHNGKWCAIKGYDEGTITGEAMDINYPVEMKENDINKAVNTSGIGSMVYFNSNLSGELDLSNLKDLTMIGYGAFVENQITSIKLPSSVETIGDSAFRKNIEKNYGDYNSNPNLAMIVNPSGNVFDWSSITGGTGNFAIGTITHENGNIEVTDK